MVGLLAWVLLDDDTYTARTPSGGPARPRPALAAAALHRLEEAVRRPDGGAPPGLGADEDAERLVDGVVDNADALRVRSFSLRYVDEEGGTAADGSWTAAVEASWRFAGFDQASAHTEISVGFAPEDDGSGLGIARLGGGGRRTPLWLTGPLQVRRGPRTLVLVDGSAARADRYAAQARRAVTVVRRVLPAWREGLVLEVPGSGRSLDRELDADPGDYANIAAVTATVDGSVAPEAPAHVFVNPAVFDRLQPRGAQVVISHEAVHAATGAATSDTPLWLLEGFADYVALRDVPLPLTTTAGQIITQVRRQGPPDHLPGQAEFDTGATHLGATYEAAWFACRLLAQQGGEQALVSLYQRVQGGAGLGATLREEFGLSVAGLTQRWRQALTDLAA